MSLPGSFFVRRVALGLLGAAVVLPVGYAVQQVSALRPFAKVENPEIDEQSGIAKSLRTPGAYWVHNDSGDSARIFAIDRKGHTIRPKGVAEADYKGIAVQGAKNVDWEDIVRDADTLVVSDMGNNGNKREDLGVYIFPEPDPRKDTSVRVRTHLRIAYPDQTEFPPKGERGFDCEAIFSVRGTFYFVTKTRTSLGLPGTRARLYRLDRREPDKVNVLTKLDERDLDGWVTSADVSPDGKTLAVLTQAPGQSVWLFPTATPGDRFLSGKARRIPLSDMKQCEGICWDDTRTLIVTNEQRDLFRVRTSAAVEAP